MNRKAQTHKRMRKKRIAIPVQPPKVPPFGTYVSPPEVPPMFYPNKLKPDGKKSGTIEKGKQISICFREHLFNGFKIPGKMYGDVQEEESSIDVSSPRDNNSPIVSKTLNHNSM